MRHAYLTGGEYPHLPVTPLTNFDDAPSEAVALFGTE